MVLSDETRSVIIKLIPFLLSIVIYFCGFIPHTDTVLLAFTKCLPIICLIVFIGMYSMDVKPEHYDSSFSWYVKMICMGLFFSGMGDVLLIWPVSFQCCLLAYMIAHVHYIFAIGFQPRGWLLGLYFYCIATAIVFFLHSGLIGLDVYLVPAYTYVASTTVWRAAAPLSDKKYWSYIRWTTIFGSVFYGLSHFIIGVEKFKIHLVYVSELDMVMYYMGQLLLTLSIMGPQLQFSFGPKFI